MPTSTNILAVDDNRVQSYAIEKKLRSVGFPVRSVHSGREALQAFASGTYDAVLLDVNLPDMDGFEVCTTIRANPSARQPAIIFHSATSASDLTFDKAHQLGADAFLTYPIETETLRTVILGCVAARHNGDAHMRMLSCWKDIARFFGKGVRTVQRWEAMGMPVHRPNRDKSIIFADPDELLRWAHNSFANEGLPGDSNGQDGTSS